MLTRVDGASTHSSSGTDVSFLESGIAFVVGIDRYQNIRTLKTAVHDALTIGEVLKTHHHIAVKHSLFDESATRARILDGLRAFANDAPEDTRAIVYLACHGALAARQAIAGDTSTELDPIRDGYLLPVEADKNDPDTWLPMSEIVAILAGMRCRHLLVILDCCFAGAFQFSGRDVQLSSSPVYRERYARYTRERASRVLASAAYDEEALDIVAGRTVGRRDAETESAHSPFADALLEALRGAGDQNGDGIITAPELLMHVENAFSQLEERTERSQQRPQLWKFRRADKGEFLFLNPQIKGPIDLKSAAEISLANNPYRGLPHFEADQAELFFGRKTALDELLQRASNPFTAVVGLSGAGKSSLMCAALLPALTKEAHTIVGPFRPGPDPEAELRGAFAKAGQLPPPAALFEEDEAAAVTTYLDGLKLPLVVAIDQLEELFTMVTHAATRERFVRAVTRLATSTRAGLHLVVTVRSDFEPLFCAGGLKDAWAKARYPIPAMTPKELRQAIELPAERAALFFEPPDLVDVIVRDLGPARAPLPLLSFALSALYRALFEDGRPERTLTQADYDEMGGAGGALSHRLQAIHDALGDGAALGSSKSEQDAAAAEPTQETLRALFLRLVTSEYGELSRRRVFGHEMVFEDAAQTTRVRKLVARLETERLLARGQLADGSHADYIELAHDALAISWSRMLAPDSAREDEQRAQLVRQQLATAVGSSGARWDRDPRLNQAVALLKRRPPVLNRAEATFVRESRARRRVLRGLGVAAIVGLAALAAVATWNAKRAAANAQQSAANAQQAKERLQRVYEESGRTEYLRHNPMRAIMYLDESYRIGPSTPTVRSLIASAASEAIDSQIATIEGHRGTVVAALFADTAVASFSPDGTRIVTASADRSTEVWDGRTGKLLATLEGHSDQVVAASFSPDGTRIVTASDDKSARLWDGRTGKLLATLRGHSSNVVAASFSPDGTRIVTASNDKSARLWDGRTGKLLARLEGHSGQVVAASFSPDGTRIVTASWDESARLWDGHTGKLMATLRGHSSSVVAASFSPDGTRIVTASNDKSARLWDGRTGKLMATLEGHSSFVVAASFSPDGTRIVTASWDNSARLWDGRTGKLMATLEGHSNWVVAASFSPDGTRIVTAGWDKSARLWDGRTGKLMATLEGHSVEAASFSPDGTRIVTASTDKSARLWDGRTGKLMATLEGHSNQVDAASFSPDGTRIVTASWDKSARLWDVRTGKLLAKLEGHSTPVVAASFSPDGTRIVTASTDKSARLWDGHTGKLMATLEGHSNAVVAASFSPDGSRIVTASWDKSARLWDVRTGKPLAKLEGHSAEVVAASFSPDGSRVVTASWDKSARVWDVRTGTLLATLAADVVLVDAASFSPDGTRIVTASGDNSARLWDSRTGRLMATLEGHSDIVGAASFSPNGTRIVTASDDKSARVWDVRTGTLLATLEGHSDAVLSASFSPDGTRIVTASLDKSARVWDAPTASLTTLEGHSDAVLSASFSLDGSRVVTASKDDSARVWDVHLETRTPNEIHKLVQCKIPLHFEGETLLPGPPNRADCPPL